jgi:hypothetical protein
MIKLTKEGNESIRSKKLKLCYVENCNNKNFGRGHCEKHYNRWRRHGDPLKGSKFRKISDKPPKLECSIENCNKQRVKHDYCVKHYERWPRHGSPFITKLKTGCIIEGCNGKHKGLGYCDLHYERLKNGTTLTQEKRIVDATRGCVFLNCIRPHWGKYHCKIHYMKVFREPKSRSKEDPILESIMNKVIRKRDKNTCKWYGCGKKTTIQVHHIFPQSEYPELKYVEQYMICYCKEHHKLWHYKRGDRCYSFLN